MGRRRLGEGSPSGWGGGPRLPPGLRRGVKESASSEKLPRFLQGSTHPGPKKKGKAVFFPTGYTPLGKEGIQVFPAEGREVGDPPEGKGEGMVVCVCGGGQAVRREQGSTLWEESRRDPRKQGCV